MAIFKEYTMMLKKHFLPFLIVFSSLNCTSLRAAFPSHISAQVLYFSHQGKVEKAFECYLDYAKEIKSYDFELLQQAACTLLEQGTSSSDPEIQLMCLFGAGVASNPSLLPILEKGIRSLEPKLQLTALNFLSRFQDDDADQLMIEALSSPFLLVRLEAAFMLAKKKDPCVIDHLQSLLTKVPDVAKPFFPQIIVEIESTAATKFLRQFLSDSDAAVRCEAILQAGDKGLDDLLPTLRMLASHPLPSEQECCAIALAQLKDESSLEYFQKWAKGKHEGPKLAALKALALFGDPEAKKLLEEEAKNKNLFAISLLESNNSSKEILKKLASDGDNTVRLNATFQLLKCKELPSIECLKEILIRNERDFGYYKCFSPGRGLSSWKIIPHATQKTKGYPTLKAQTIRLREHVLRLTLELPENQFLEVAKMIFAHKQTDLIPLLVQLLSNHKSPDAIALLKQQQQKAGAPFIRNYCNLALYQLQEEGPYEENLLRWVQSEEKNCLIRFKEESLSDQERGYSLTPEETSQLLIESFEALASAQNEKGVEALLHAIAYGNPKNRYALAGLLMRTSE